VVEADGHSHYNACAKNERQMPLDATKSNNQQEVTNLTICLNGNEKNTRSAN
jgi:hypothetical protein